MSETPFTSDIGGRGCGPVHGGSEPSGRGGVSGRTVTGEDTNRRNQVKIGLVDDSGGRPELDWIKGLVRTLPTSSRSVSYTVPWDKGIL